MARPRGFPVPVKKPDGRWHVDFRLDGAESRRVRSSHATKAEALQFVREKLANPTETPPDRRALLDLIELWWELHGRNLSDGAKRKSKMIYLADLLGNPRANKLTALVWSQFRGQRLDAGASENTCNKDLTYFRALFSSLKSHGQWPGDIPLADVKLLRVQETEMHYLELDQIAELLSVAGDSSSPELVPIIKTALSTGARWSEACGLRLEQLRNGVVTFSKTKSFRVRHVPVAPAFEDLVSSWASEQKITRGKIFQTNPLGAFRRAVERSSIDLPRGQLTHVLRHTFASHYVINGGDILRLQKLLGHQSIETTMIYAHLAPDHLSDIRDKNPLALLEKSK